MTPKVSVVVGVLVAATVVGTPAFAYVRYRSKSDCPYYWRERSLRITGFPKGLTGMTVEEITTAATGAAAVWSKGDPALGACTNLDLKVTMQEVSAVPPAAKYDRKNNLMFRGDTWCVMAANDLEECHDPSALAITSVFATTSGQIVDADVEVNGVNFVWADLVTSPNAPAGSQDLQNTLTHELGHLIGLDHTCLLQAGGPTPKDHTGQSIPICSGASAAVRATTMFASADPGDLSKRDLEPDDQQAVCDTYPLVGVDPLICEVPDSGGCRVAAAAIDEGRSSMATRSAWGAAAAALAIAAFLGAKRRSRRR